MAAIAKMVLFFSVIVFSAAKYVVGAEPGTGPGPFLPGTTDLVLGVHRNRYLLQSPQIGHPPNDDDDGKKKSKSRTVLLTGAAGVGGFLAVGLLLLLLIWPKKLYEHWKKRKSELIRAEQRVVVTHTKEESVTFDPKLLPMNMTDLATATNDFDKNRSNRGLQFGMLLLDLQLLFPRPEAHNCTSKVDNEGIKTAQVGTKVGHSIIYL
ncbi:hypothetical protein SUGI_0934030 [Cryptomeria japonica]|nr:hypothetical protein SUGI_0934030 [Cryptomeria japonica]